MKLFRYKYITAAVLFCASLSFSYHPSPAAYAEGQLILDELISEAVKNSPEIIAAKKRYDASLDRVPQAKSLDNLQVGFEFMKIPRGTIKLDKTMPADRKLTFSQMFPFFGKLSLKGKIALVESQMYAASYKDKELEIINEVKKAYYDLFLNYKEVELNQQSLDLLNSIVKTAEVKYVVGDVEQEAIFKINLEIARFNNDILNLEQERQSKITLINTLLNREPEAPIGEPQLKEYISFNYDMNRLYRLTVENNPQLLMFSYMIDKGEYAEKLARKSFLPDVMLGTAFSGLASGTGIGAWDLMMSFSVPLWFWSKQRYEIKEAVNNLEEAKAAYQAMKNKALSRTKDFVVKIETARNKIKLYKDNMTPIIESSIESSLSALRSGHGDFMMLLDSERMLVQTKMNYYSALVEYNMNLSDLERAVGISLSEVRNEK